MLWLLSWSHSLYCIVALIHSSHRYHTNRTNIESNLKLRTGRESYHFSKQQQQQCINRKRSRTCNHMVVHYYETSYDTWTIHQYTLLGCEEGHPLFFSFLFCHGGPAGARVLLLAATAVSSCLWSLDAPRGAAWTQRHAAPLANEKSSPPPCGVRQTVCCLSPWSYECMYTGVVDRGVVIWWWCGEGGVFTTKTKEGKSGGFRVAGVRELMYVLWLAQSSAKNSWKLDKVDKTR